MTAIVLANLCVSYIMTSQNEDAEELMRKIEKEEERLTFSEPDKQVSVVLAFVPSPPHLRLSLLLPLRTSPTHPSIHPPTHPPHP